MHIAEPLYFYRQHGGSTSLFSRRIGEYRQRDLMYRRHQPFFDRYRAGGEFRAMGYISSALFAWKARRPGVAIAVAFRGLASSGVRGPFVRSVVVLGIRRLRALRIRRMTHESRGAG
jgi:hypothetical protein